MRLALTLKVLINAGPNRIASDDQGGSPFGVPGYRWLEAKRTLTVDYCAFLMPAARVPESVEWDSSGVRIGN